MNTSLETLKPQWLPPVSNSSQRILQRACDCGNHSGGGQCEGCRQKRSSLQRAAENSTQHHSGAPPIVHDVLRSPGHPLDTATRSFMEPRFGHDFSGVQIHTDARAAESARAVNAAAYTVGSHVVFGQGRYAPHTSAGQRLLAHELTHTIQQGDNAASTTGSLDVSEAHDPYEQEADRVTDKVMASDSAVAGASGPVSVSSASLRVGPVRLARQEEVASGDPVPTVGQEQPIPMDTETPAPKGPECSRLRGWGQSLPLSNTAFRGERGFAYVPTDGYPGAGGVIVTGSSVSIRITARWEEQIPNAADRPADQRNRRADSPQYYLSFNGWVDDCDRSSAGRSASSVHSGNLSIGTEHTVQFQSLTPGRYGLQINPSTASPEPNRVLTGTCEIT